MIKGSKIINELDLESIPEASKNYFWMIMTSNAIGTPIYMPVMVAKGTEKGSVLGITAAVHGNEVNGIQVIQRLFDDINPEEMKGTLVAVPVVNVPGFNLMQREFVDGFDLNRIMPGKETGNDSEAYVHLFIEKILKKTDYLLDLHTASFGRINSYYVRADMDRQPTNKLALLQNAQIIVNNKAHDGTLRGAADQLNIPAITLEVGNPATFQLKKIKSSMEGIHNTLIYLGMIADEYIQAEHETHLCNSSFWIYTDIGGLLTIHAELTEKVTKGDHIATIRDVFGNVLKEYTAPENGIVIGKSTNPANQTGGRIIHLGINSF
jgi:predicted deacylase